MTGRCLSLVIGLLALGMTGAEPVSKNPLLGDWQVVNVEGGPLAAGMKANVARVQIDAEQITAGRAAAYTVEEGKKEIDLEITKGPNPERGTYKGIYELKDTTLKIHLGLPGKPRPANFSASADTVLLTLSKGNATASK